MNILSIELGFLWIWSWLRKFLIMYSTGLVRCVVHFMVWNLMCRAVQLKCVVLIDFQNSIITGISNLSYVAVSIMSMSIMHLNIWHLSGVRVIEIILVFFSLCLSKMSKLYFKWVTKFRLRYIDVLSFFLCHLFPSLIRHQHHMSDH